MKYIALIFIIFLLSACKEEPKTIEIHPFDKVKKQQEEKFTTPISISELDWIEGKWIDSTSFLGHIIVEDWNLKYDTLIGKRGTMKNGEISFTQTSKIIITKGKPVYLLEPNGSAFVSFRLNEYTSDKISFINIANVAPQEIIYTKKNKELELTVISLTPAGKRTFKNIFKAFNN